jgi:hypothetical protein
MSESVGNLIANATLLASSLHGFQTAQTATFTLTDAQISQASTVIDVGVGCTAAQDVAVAATIVLQVVYTVQSIATMGATAGMVVDCIVGSIINAAAAVLGTIVTVKQYTDYTKFHALHNGFNTPDTNTHQSAADVLTDSVYGRIFAAEETLLDPHAEIVPKTQAAQTVLDIYNTELHGKLNHLVDAICEVNDQSSTDAADFKT